MNDRADFETREGDHRSTTTAAYDVGEPNDDGESARDREDPLEAGRRLLEDLDLLKEHVRLYLSVRAVALKDSVRRFVLVAAAVILISVLLAALAVAAAVQLAGGLAEALTELLGRPWLGALLSGCGILALLAGAFLGVELWLRRRRMDAVTRRFGAWRRTLRKRHRARTGGALIEDGGP